MRVEDYNRVLNGTGDWLWIDGCLGFGGMWWAHYLILYTFTEIFKILHYKQYKNEKNLVTYYTICMAHKMLCIKRCVQTI
jgi:hypothetical protein